MAFKIRFLLTTRCTATCSYCHNEGQDKRGSIELPIELVQHVLNTLKAHRCMPDEIVLSGGEPTLHKKVAEIAQLCKAAGAYVSMDTHAGHPQRLQPALPYLDELKVHIDSFDSCEQRASMGIDIENVLLSIRMAQSAQLLLQANHPLKHAASTQAFVRAARKYGLDCKIIDMFGPVDTANFQQSVNWAEQGYTCNVGGDWLHENGTHRLHTKGCGEKHNQQDDTLFIGADGIRRALDGIIIGKPENFTMLMVKSAQGSASYSRSCAHGSAPVTRRFNKLEQLPIQ